MDKYTKKIIGIFTFLRVIFALGGGILCEIAINKDIYPLLILGIFLFLMSLIFIFVEARISDDSYNIDIYLGSLELMKESNQNYPKEEYEQLRKRLIKSKYQKLILKLLKREENKC